jgi:hypothetical protein
VRNHIRKLLMPINPRLVIPGHAKHEPGIYNQHREHGFRACAKRRIPE